MTNLKYRILTVVALMVASIWTLWPRTVVERVKRNGVFVFDTVQRVPLKRGRDLTRVDRIAKDVGGPTSAGALGDTARRAQSGLDKLFTADTGGKGSDS